MHIKIKRVYEKPDNEDGRRILVDRLWPRGLTKEKASIHQWLKNIASGTELRKWFGHDPKKCPRCQIPSGMWTSPTAPRRKAGSISLALRTKVL